MSDAEDCQIINKEGTPLRVSSTTSSQAPTECYGEGSHHCEEDTFSTSDHSVSSNHSRYSNDQRVKMRRKSDTRRSHKRRAKGDGEYRLQAKQLGLTYSQCPRSRESFDEWFKTEFGARFGGITVYQSAREDHKDGSKHLHVFIEFARRADVSHARYFDMAFEGNNYHPRIERIRSKAAWLKYISKGDDFELSGDIGFDPLQEKLGKRKSMHADFLWSEQYRQYAKLKEVQYPIKLITESKTYEMLKPDPNIKRRNWWIVAQPNAGKTYWMNKTFKGQKIYCPRMGKYPFEGYKNQDIIIYDDRTGVTFEEFADVANTWDVPKPVYGEVRFVTQDWKLGHTRSIIVLSNHTIEETMKEEDWVRMKKRFIQIINPTLKNESSDDEEDEQKEMPAAASQSFANAFVVE